MKNKPEHEYSPDKFDADYYGNRARGGFGPEIHWDNPIQQVELAKKYEIVSKSGNFNSILFIGCALGNEVRYFRQYYKDATGVDISKYAIENCDLSVKPYCKVYNGWELSDYNTASVDVVAAFDVLTLVPDDMLKKLVKEMCRVSASSIVVRTIVDIQKKRNGDWVGNDGVTFRYLTFDQWKELFLDEDFIIRDFSVNAKDEVVFLFQRML